MVKIRKIKKQEKLLEEEKRKSRIREIDGMLRKGGRSRGSTQPSATPPQGVAQSL